MNLLVICVLMGVGCIELFLRLKEWNELYFYLLIDKGFGSHVPGSLHIVVYFVFIKPE